VFTQRLELSAAVEKANVGAGTQESGAEQAADRATAKDQDSHRTCVLRLSGPGILDEGARKTVAPVRFPAMNDTLV
jgi:hypothetical protein